MNDLQPQTGDAERDVLVLGAGLAGSFAARALAQRGWRVRVLDRQPIGAVGPASYAPRVALLQPKINDHNDPPGNRLRDGFTLARSIVTEQLGNDPRVGWRPCGAFHACYDERSTKRLRRFIAQFGPSGLCRWIEPSQTHEELGIALDTGGVIIDAAGVLRPAGLCAALLDHPGIRVQGGVEVNALHQTGNGWRMEHPGGEAIEATRVVVANAMDALRLQPTAHLELRPIRGQASLVPATLADGDEPLAKLRRILCFGGYLTPAVDGRHTLGASFVPGDSATDWRDADHHGVCDKIARVLPRLADTLNQQDGPAGWTGTRCTTPSRQPYAGQVQRDGQPLPGLYATLGHGSHGICSAAISAKQIANAIH